MKRVVCRGWGIEWECSCCGRLVEGAAPSATMRGLACDDCLDHNLCGEPFIPLTVKMVDRKAKPDARPVIAVCVRDFTCLLETGETFPLEELPRRLRDRSHGGANKFEDPPLPPAIVVTDQGVDLLAWLDGSELAEDPFWQWQVALTEMSAWRPEARSQRVRAVSLQPRPLRFGFASRMNGRRRAHGAARWYQLVDVHRFVELPGGWGECDMRDLMKFGVELRDWCNRAGVPVGSSASAIGGRLLRDSRFGDGWRRKVPAATNARARKLLPGNHYQLLTAADKRIPEAHKWDMARAHHWAALNVRFPHPDTLDVRGFFRHAPTDGSGFFRTGSRAWKRELERPGMFIVRVDVPERVTLDPLVLPMLRRPGRRWVGLSSEEIEEVRRLGVDLGDIWCSWTAEDTDERLNEYSFWAQRELQQADAPRWLKPALLAAYGLLAAKPRGYRAAWRKVHRPAGGIGWNTAHGVLLGVEVEPGRPREPQTANVVWRCLIESRVRLEAIRFARDLRAARLRPVAIYADAVFATGDIPGTHGVPPPWRYEGVIHDLTFDGPSRYRSREETRLPGIPRRRDGGLVRAH